MAANTTPFVVPSAGGTGRPINVNKVVSVQKIDGISAARPDLPASQRPANFSIQFAMEDIANNIRYMYFDYDDSGDRDDDYDDFVATYGYVLQTP